MLSQIINRLKIYFESIESIAMKHAWRNMRPDIQWIDRRIESSIAETSNVKIFITI